MIQLFELILVLATPVARAADGVPTLHHTGIGSRLIDAAIQAASQDRFDGMLVKANPDA
ncbi:MAG: hypothetical protein LJE70_07710 [Chromatiaceae bacterium]|jgi:hypothetical protein|nr:hypothetical protein [Chromatiaceae bacterium]